MQKAKRYQKGAEEHRYLEICSNRNPDPEGMFVKPFLNWPLPSSPVKCAFSHEFYFLKDSLYNCALMK